MARRGYDEVTLVTGFPNFRARKMVEYLLATEPRSLVYLVVRKALENEASAALARLPKGQRERVVIIEGDAAAMDLGLSGAEYRTLGAEVDRVHHLAQITYPGVPRETTEATNIGAMREVIELGRCCTNMRSIVVHSTALVSGNREGLVLEDDLNAGQAFRTPVEETLARAERLARSALPELPIVVLRPTWIVGDSTTGEIERFDGPYLLVLLLVTSPQDLPVPLPTRGDALLHLVPIDYVVRAAHFIGRHPKAIGRTFHLADPRPLTVRRVFELVAASGGKRLPGGFIPTRVTKALLSAPGLGLLAKSPRAFVDMLATPVRYDTRNSAELLHDSGIVCPPFESYVDTLVAHVRGRVQERRVQSRADRFGEVEDALY
ncbi:MAG: SDR family oxidoreductase [Polyangiaceae bacterium]|nr:SDR family oxidoreductase [Polyangiaceae bacterium]MCK6533401.1 SDR family oxidoreductase [Polyangiaceae bacterium]